MAEVQIKLTKPTIEIPVTAIDYSGKSATIRVGFYRRKRKVARFLLDFLQAQTEEEKEALLEKRPKSKFLDTLSAKTGEEEILKSSISYMKNLEITVDGTDIVVDTRKNLPNDLTLEDLINIYLEDTTFYPALTTNFLKSLSTFDFENARLGN